jgi:DNA primase
MSTFLLGILEDFLGETRKHNEYSGQVSFDCPACSAEKGIVDGDGKGNLEINYNRNVYKCWSCAETNNMSGSVIKLLKKYGGKNSLRDYLLVRPDADNIIEKEHKDIIVTLPEGYKKISEVTIKDYNYNLALKYLRERGITDKIIREFNIGYTNKGEFFNRIIIPSYDSDNKLNYFIARWFSPKYTKLKYINPTTEKQEIIFNENKINFDSTIYLCEGVFDHIVIPNSIPLLGKFISEKLLELLYEKANCNIIIVLDSDAVKDAINLYKTLNFGNLTDRIKICVPSINEDPSSIYQKLAYKGIISLLRTSRKPTNDELNE